MINNVRLKNVLSRITIAKDYVANHQIGKSSHHFSASSVFLADIENVFFQTSVGKTADFEDFKTFYLKSWKVSQTWKRFQIF